MLNDSPMLPGVTPLTKPFGPRSDDASSGTQEICTLPLPCWYVQLEMVGEEETR